MITELDKQKRAKEYMDKLAQGINPLTNEPLPQDTVLNNVRLARCFFYVSGVLRQLIENGGRTDRRAGSLKPFSMTGEEIKRVQVVDSPVTVSALVNAINNAAAGQQMKKLTAAAVTNWLAGEGYLRVVEDERGRHKDITGKSKDIGISSEQKDGAGGPYISILYDANAQRFILEHLDSIISG